MSFLGPDHIAKYTIYGNSRPDGAGENITDAPVGAQYIFNGDGNDLEDVLGARVWRKAPDAWQVVEGSFMIPETTGPVVGPISMSKVGGGTAQFSGYVNVTGEITPDRAYYKVILSVTGGTSGGESRGILPGTAMISGLYAPRFGAGFVDVGQTLGNTNAPSNLSTQANFVGGGRGMRVDASGTLHFNGNNAISGAEGSTYFALDYPCSNSKAWPTAMPIPTNTYAGMHIEEYLTARIADVGEDNPELVNQLRDELKIVRASAE